MCIRDRTGGVVGTIGKLIPQTAIRAPVLIGGFAGKTYAQTGSVDAAIESAITIAGFEALGLAGKVKQRYNKYRLEKNLPKQKAIEQAVTDVVAEQPPKPQEPAPAVAGEQKIPKPIKTLPKPVQPVVEPKVPPEAVVKPTEVKPKPVPPKPTIKESLQVQPEKPAIEIEQAPEGAPKELVDLMRVKKTATDVKQTKGLISYGMAKRPVSGALAAVHNLLRASYNNLVLTHPDIKSQGENKIFGIMEWLKRNPSRIQHLDKIQKRRAADRFGAENMELLGKIQGTMRETLFEQKWPEDKQGFKKEFDRARRAGELSGGEKRKLRKLAVKRGYPEAFDEVEAKREEQRVPPDVEGEKQFIREYVAKHPKEPLLTARDTQGQEYLDIEGRDWIDKTLKERKAEIDAERLDYAKENEDKTDLIEKYQLEADINTPWEEVLQLKEEVMQGVKNELFNEVAGYAEEKGGRLTTKTKDIALSLIHI